MKLNTLVGIQKENSYTGKLQSEKAIMKKHEYTQQEAAKIEAAKAAIKAGTFDYAGYGIPGYYYAIRPDIREVYYPEFKQLEETPLAILMQVLEDPPITIWIPKSAYIVDIEHNIQMRYGYKYIRELQKEFFKWARARGAKVSGRTPRLNIMFQLAGADIDPEEIPDEYRIFFY